MKKNKLLIVRSILIILTLAVCVIIFALSADNADESNAKSDPISDSMIIKILETFDLDEEQIEFVLEKTVVIIRKTAHFAEYALLGFLLAAVCTSFYKSRKSTLIISQICGSAYAVSDEIHQYFVPGRSCQIKDMLIDSGGVLCGIIFLLLIVFLYFRIKKNKGTPENSGCP